MTPAITNVRFSTVSAWRCHCLLSFIWFALLPNHRLKNYSAWMAQVTSVANTVWLLLLGFACGCTLCRASGHTDHHLL